jgi:integrase
MARALENVDSRIAHRDAAGISGREDLDNGLTFHDLRHEATSRLLEKGLNLREVAHTVGHTTLQMLVRYTHPKTKAIANKLDKPAA